MRAHELKLKTLEALRPSLGAQTTELYGRFALKPSTVFNHQARGNKPSSNRHLKYALDYFRPPRAGPGGETEHRPEADGELGHRGGVKRSP